MRVQFVLGVVGVVAILCWPLTANAQAVVGDDGVTVDPVAALEPVTVTGARTPMEAAGETWGTEGWVAVNIPGVAFQPQWGTQYGHFGNGAIHKFDGQGAYFHAPLVLPEGALIDGYTATVYDSSATQNVRLQLYRCGGNPDDACGQLGDLETAGSLGWEVKYLVLPGGDHTYRTWDYSAYDPVFYRLYLTLSDLDGLDSSLRFKGVIVWYRNQVSPAPASATFGDVPTGHMFFRYVEALAQSGITAGCGGGNFCPDSPVTRGQMAVFLSKALGLHWVP